MLPSSFSDPAHKIRPERPKTPLPAAFSAREGRGLFIKQNQEVGCKGNVTNTFYHAGMIFWNAASTISSFGFSAVMSLGIIYF